MCAYAQLNGHFDLKRTPMALPGARVIAHEKADQRASWDPHVVDGYYQHWTTTDVTNFTSQKQKGRK
jgi:hypothetical protein